MNVIYIYIYMKNILCKMYFWTRLGPPKTFARHCLRQVFIIGLVFFFVTLLFWYLTIKDANYYYFIVVLNCTCQLLLKLDLVPSENDFNTLNRNIAFSMYHQTCARRYQTQSDMQKLFRWLDIQKKKKSRGGVKCVINPDS